MPFVAPRRVVCDVRRKASLSFESTKQEPDLSRLQEGEKVQVKFGEGGERGLSCSRSVRKDGKRLEGPAV